MRLPVGCVRWIWKMLALHPKAASMLMLSQEGAAGERDSLRQTGVEERGAWSPLPPAVPFLPPHLLAGSGVMGGRLGMGRSVLGPAERLLLRVGSPQRSRIESKAWKSKVSYKG